MRYRCVCIVVALWAFTTFAIALTAVAAITVTAAALGTLAILAGGICIS